MQTRHLVAVVLTAACLLLISALAFRNLNSSSKTITAVQPMPAGAISWQELMNRSAEALQLPPTVMVADSILIASGATDTMLIKRNLEFFENNSYFIPAARYEKLLASIYRTTDQWGRAGLAIYKAGVSEIDSVIRDFLMAEAITCFDEVLKRDTVDFEATLYKGLALADKRSTMMMGVPLLLQAVKQQPDNVPANYTLAMLAIESGQLDKALSRFEKLISLQPSNPEYHFQVARVYEMSGRREEALSEYRKSHELTTDPQTRELIQKMIDNLK